MEKILITKQLIDDMGSAFEQAMELMSTPKAILSQRLRADVEEFYKDEEVKKKKQGKFFMDGVGDEGYEKQEKKK